VRLDTNKLAAARLLAGERQPFLAVALYALTPIAAPGLGTFAVDDKWRLYIDPQTLSEWSVMEVAGVLMHEVGHVVRDHANRARESGVDETLRLAWNIAGDAEINDDLIADGLTLPKGVITPASLKLPRGKAAEYYFERIKGRAHLPECNCGSGAHGVTDQLDELGTTIAGISEVEQQLLRRVVALAVVAHLAGRAAGSHGGGWDRWAEAFLHPVIDWRKSLRAAIRRGLFSSAGRVDYSYSRPSRQQIPGLVLPSLMRPVPQIGIVVDTSGSMDERRLSMAWTEVLGVLRAQGMRRDSLTVWATDTRPIKVTAFSTTTKLAGGGGTDLRVGIELAMSQRPKPHLLIVLTDGETPWPTRAPTVPVIVALLAHHLDIATPKWATVVNIPEAAQDNATAT
jgi:predicted metal-dependent peptidase